MYKNARIFKITDPDTYNVFKQPLLNEAAQQCAFVPLQGQEAIRLGFVPAYPYASSDFFYTAHACLFFAIKTQWKDIPATALADAMQPLIAELKANTGRQLTKREIADVKEQVLQQLIPRALPKSKVLQGYFDTKKQLLVFNSSSNADTESAMALIRKAVGTLPALPWLDNHILNAHLNLWCKEQLLPDNILRGHNGSFKAPDSCGAVSSFKNHIFDERVTNHLQDKLCTKLEMYWPERLSFTLDHIGVFSKLSWDSIYIGKNEEMGYDDIPARIEADLLLMVSALRDLFASYQNRLAVAPPAADDKLVTEQLLVAARTYLLQEKTVTADQLASRFDVTLETANILATALMLQGVKINITSNSSGQFIYEVAE